ncbi:hypothetical protein [Burkholderia gladioli]|uniref:hypothetical protein n=1 Tax=Burkholderia gladioli TaxID=28095 RepID=UPI00163E5678|nr:hypothetical protein [Burkholderia gladioli]
MPAIGRRTVLGASAVGYVLSLLLPAMYFEKAPPLSGLALLGQGWFGLLTLNQSGLANPFYLYAVVQFARRRDGRAAAFGGAALACALCSFFTKDWYFNEANATPIAGLGIGFYVWLLARAAFLLGSLRLSRSAAATH